MRRLRRLLLFATAAVLAAVALYLVATLPPATRHLPAAPPTTVFGAYHIHTNRSDGSGTLDDVAAAASEAGLHFVVITDHGDGTRAPEPPHYRHGVLVVDAVEISTISGHLVAIGLSAPSPYRLGGEARDTLEDVHRMGGWVVAAHPDSPHPELRWRGDILLDGIEWLNADSEWRDERPARLLRTLGHYLFRRHEAIASLFSRPAASLNRWDELSKMRPMTGLAAADAHARIGTDEDAQQQSSRTILTRPTYRDMFLAVAQAVPVSEPMSGDAALDARVILDALRNGRTYSVVRAVADPGQITFEAISGDRRAVMGESLDGSHPAQIRAFVPAPADASVVLLRDGQDVASGSGSVTFAAPATPALYRAEVRVPGSTVPWIVTNHIRIGAPPPAIESRPAMFQVIRALDDFSVWKAEKHSTSVSDVRPADGVMAMTFQLTPGPISGQYAAMSHVLPGGEDFTAIRATLRAAAPMRLSVQVRQPGGVDGERWHRSVYVDETPREVTLALSDFQLGEIPTPRKPTPTLLRSVMFVVDTWHTKPGTSGTVWVSGVSIGRLSEPATSAR